MKFAPTLQELNSEQHENYRGFTDSVKFIRSSPSSRVVPIQKKGPSQNEQKPPLEEVFQDLFLLYGIQYHFFEFL